MDSDSVSLRDQASERGKMQALQRYLTPNFIRDIKEYFLPSRTNTV